MPASDRLFELIQSMTASERKYFKILTGYQEGEKKYLKLFLAIEEQPEYDEEALRSVLIGERMLNQLHVTKNYLYHQILESLRSRRTFVSPLSEIAHMVEEIEVLWERGLPSHCTSILEKAKRMAIEHESFSQLLSILNWERTLALKLFYKESVEADLRRIGHERDEVLEKITNLYTYEHINAISKLFFVRDGMARSEEESKIFESITGNVFLNAVENAKSFRAQHLHHIVLARYYQVVGKEEESRMESVAALQPFMDDPTRIDSSPIEYLTSLVWYYDSSFGKVEFHILVDTIERIREVPVRTKDVQALVFFLANTMELDLFIQTGEIAKGKEVISKLQRGLDLYDKLLSPLSIVLIYFRAAHILFAIGEYDNALIWLNKALAEKELIKGQELYYTCRLFNLILHYEMGNKKYLEYAIQSTQRYLSTTNNLYQSERALLKLLKKLPELRNPAMFREACVRFKDELVGFMSDPFERYAFRYFDLIAWIDSKIDRESYALAVEHRAKLANPATGVGRPLEVSAIEANDSEAQMEAARVKSAQSAAVEA
jgi:hypothetical protein